MGALHAPPKVGLSKRGALVLATIISFGLYGCVANLYDFQAVTNRVDSDTMVVEGWIHEYATRLAAEEFRQANYRLLPTTGGPVVGEGAISTTTTRQRAGGHTS